MRLFASSTPQRDARRHERCASARPPLRDLTNTPSLSAHPLTKHKPASTAPSRKTFRRNKNAVHPIDLRDLESELDLLPDPAPLASVVSTDTITEQPVPISFTATIAVLHALDLHNPCQIRSCPHAFVPHVQLSVDDAAVAGFEAARHAKNHSSWPKEARVSRHIDDGEKPPQLHIVRVMVSACCARHPNDPLLVAIGRTDDIPLALDPNGVMISQFYPVFRYQVVQNRMAKYYAGKIKLAISTTPDQLREPDSAALVSPCETPLRRPFLPVNFGDALQLKRQQLKAMVAPEIVNHSIVKPGNDRNKAQALLETLMTKTSHLLVPMSDISIHQVIGEGIHADVFQVRIGNVQNDVAMKEFRYDGAGSGALPPLAVLQAFGQEFNMLAHFSKGALDHVLGLVGVMLTPRLALLTDYCSDGSLARCLHDHQLWSKVSMKTKLGLARHIATGLASLHQMNIIHRDIKPHNIMIHGLASQYPLAKVGDLGSAVTLPSPDSLLHDETGSSGYTAPEVFRATGYNQCADIWSLGIVLWELLLGGSPQQLCNPFHGVCGDDVVDKANKGARPRIPPDALSPLCYALLTRCWNLDPSKRPTANEVAMALDRIISQECEVRRTQFEYE